MLVLAVARSAVTSSDERRTGTARSAHLGRGRVTEIAIKAAGLAVTRARAFDEAIGEA